jgi:hypothetical protein
MNKEDRMRFMKVYQNLPLNERKNTIIILDDKSEKPEKKPISWDVAYIEIDQETRVGETILNKLIKLNLI